MAVHVAVAARDSEIARLEREMLELEDRWPSLHADFLSNIQQ